MPTLIDDLRAHLDERTLAEEWDAAEARLRAFVAAYDALLALPAWTSDPPTEPGLYRFREEGKKIRWVMVDYLLHGTLIVSEFYSDEWENMDELRGLWCGPIVVEESTPAHSAGSEE